MNSYIILAISIRRGRPSTLKPRHNLGFIMRIHCSVSVQRDIMSHMVEGTHAIAGAWISDGCGEQAQSQTNID
jgi:hypothetical protein